MPRMRIYKETAAHVTMARVTREESLACECEQWCETHTKLEKQLREEQGVLSRLFLYTPVQSSKSMYTGPTRSTKAKKDDNQLNKSDLSVH